MSIELKVGEVDPPGVIMDIVNIPDPVYLGFRSVVYNYDDVGLYFRVTGSGTGWTFSTVDLGLIGSGANLITNLDNFCNRARPASETTEYIQLILRAYTDAGYSNLKWTYTKTLEVWWIKSDDGSWTQDFLNNFDDGTVQTWAAAAVSGIAPVLEVRTDFVLSSPYSLAMRFTAVGGNESDTQGYIYKSFATPNRNNVLAVMDIRVRTDTYWYAKMLKHTRNTTILQIIGRDESAPAADRFPPDRWLRLIVPIPKNVTVPLRIYLRVYYNNPTGIGTWHCILYMDDFRIISRD